MEKVAEFVNWIRLDRFDTDWVDKLFWRQTPKLLILSAFIILAKEHGGNAINCWGNSEWTDSFSEYANDYCFVEGTYYVPINDQLLNADDRSTIYPSLKYYPWLAFLFALQALVFYLPYFMWRSFNKLASGGIDLNSASQESYQMSFITGSDIVSRVNLACRLERIFTWIHHHHTEISSGSFKSFYYQQIRRKFLTISYLMLKTTNLALIILNLKFLTFYLANTSSITDFTSIYKMLVNSSSWKSTAKFPRIAMCDFEIRGIESNVQKYTQQCVLVANMINEKIFVVVWIWCWILFVIGIVNLITWLYFLFFPGRSYSYVFDLIVSGNAANEETFKEEFTKKVRSFKRKFDDTRELLEEINNELRAQNLKLKRLDIKEIKLVRQTYDELIMLRRKFIVLDFTDVFDNFLSYIGMDGILMFKIMQLNSTQLITSELMSQFLFQWAHVHGGVDTDKLSAEDKLVVKFMNEYIRSN